MKQYNLIGRKVGVSMNSTPIQCDIFSERNGESIFLCDDELEFLSSLRPLECLAITKQLLVNHSCAGWYTVGGYQIQAQPIFSSMVIKESTIIELHGINFMSW